MLSGQTGGCRAVERQHSRQHLLIQDRQAVLIGGSSWLSFKNFWSRVGRCQTVDLRGSPLVNVLDQPEVGNFETATEQQQIRRFNVQVL